MLRRLRVTIWCSVCRIWVFLIQQRIQMCYWMNECCFIIPHLLFCWWPRCSFDWGVEDFSWLYCSSASHEPVEESTALQWPLNCYTFSPSQTKPATSLDVIKWFVSTVCDEYNFQSFLKKKTRVCSHWTGVKSLIQCWVLKYLKPVNCVK